MANFNFTEQEVKIIKTSLQNCLTTCKNIGSGIRCPDCEAVGEMLKKFDN